MKKRTVLLSIMGTSPAVLTETVYALAHQRRPVVPDEIVVLTTVTGAEKLRKEVFGKDAVWTSLVRTLQREEIPVVGKLAFGDSSHAIRVLSDANGSRDLDDIRTAEDNTQMADAFLRVLRGYTEDPSTCVYASIAGGRKTMSALMLSCMSLLGRDCDHVLHVLVNEPFDTRLEPMFFFPKKNARHKDANGKCHPASEARIELIDLPFVKMRGWYQDKFSGLPPSYAELVRGIQAIAPDASILRPMLEFDFERGKLFCERQDCQLKPAEFLATVCLLLDREKTVSGMLKECFTAKTPCRLDWFCLFQESNRSFDPKDFDPETFTLKEAERRVEANVSRVLTELRGELKKIPGLRPYFLEVAPLRNQKATYPEDRISGDIQTFRECVGIR